MMVCAWARRLRGWRSGLLCLPLLAACLGPPYETGRVQDLVPGAREQAVRVDGRSIHWVEVGDEAASPVLFIHGTPGNWQAYADYLNAPELAGFHRIAVDRPGFGESAEGGVEPSLSRQAELLAEAFADLPPMILVGHSLGGSLAMQLARDAPDRIAGIVLVAASLDPAVEAPRWFNRVASWPVIRAVVPDPLAKANVEVLVLQQQLQALWSGWTVPRLPIVLIQGMEDSLVRPSTADFAESRLAAESVTIHRIENAGHFVLWEQPSWTIEAILRLAEP